MANNAIIKVWQDDIQLVLRFNVESIPDLAYVNTQLRSRLQHVYDQDIIRMMKDMCRGIVDIFFCPEDNGSVSSDMWDALCTVLDEYCYTLKDARSIIQWMEECVVMEDVGHVYAQILEGASN